VIGAATRPASHGPARARREAVRTRGARAVWHAQVTSTRLARPSSEPVLQAVDTQHSLGLSADQRHYPNGYGGQHQLSTLSGTGGNQPGITGK
jgi:hypothetical protein